MTDQPPVRGITSTQIIVVVVLIAIIAAVAVYARQASQSSEEVAVATITPSTAASTAAATPVTTPTSSAQSTADSGGNDPVTTYTDGQYSSTGSYSSPGGTESIKVDITIANDVITAATVTSQATNPTSKQYQQKFINGYSSFVVGKNVADLSLTTVSGSSLTPKGFNAALTSIRLKAQS